MKMRHFCAFRVFSVEQHGKFTKVGAIREFGGLYEFYFCDPSRHLQESPGPPGPKSQKSLKKGLLGGLEKSLEKYPKKSKNTEKIPKKVRKLIFLDFLGYFSRLFSRPPKRPFLRLFCDFGPLGPGDSCKWRLGSQFYLFFLPKENTPNSAKKTPLFRELARESGFLFGLIGPNDP